MPGHRRWGAALLLATASATCGPTPTAPPEPLSTLAAGPGGIVLGCASIEAAECHFVADQILAMLPATRGRPFDIEIVLFGCPDAVPCPPTLAARQGRAVVDFVDGEEPITVSLTGPPGAPRIAMQAGIIWSGLVQPTSARVGGAGPFSFELGHCGLSHVVDFDGSFWVPIGQVDGDAPGMINGESGGIRLLGPNLARYEGPAGFVAQLARFPGPKRFFLCD